MQIWKICRSGTPYASGFQVPPPVNDEQVLILFFGLCGGFFQVSHSHVQPAERTGGKQKGGCNQ